MTIAKSHDRPGVFCYDNNVAVREIQSVVAETFGIPATEMVSRRRAQPVAFVRQVAMYLSRELTPYSLPNLGRFFGDRDHTTIIHGISVVEKRIAGDRDFAEKIRSIRGLFSDGEMNRRNRILRVIDDPSVRKIVIMHWRERGNINDEQTEQLIRDNQLEAA